MDVRSILKVQKTSPLHDVNQDEISNKSNIINDESEREDAENNLSVTYANDNDIIFVTRENSNLDKCELKLRPGINSNTVMNESQEKKQMKSSKRSYGKPGLSKSSDENEEIIAKGGKCARVKFNSQKIATKSRCKRRNSEDTEQPSPLSISTSNSTSPSADGSCSEDNSSYGQFSQAVPPDGGWGWVVVAASFMVNLIADGITFSFGVIFVEFLNYFGEGKSKTAWIGSLFMAMPLLSGPVASFLTDRYGCRRVSIAGSILATCGFVVSSFTKSMGVLILTFGVVAGFGLSLCFVAAVVIVAYYFDKRRSFATGLSVCGSGIGTFIFPPLTQYLLAEYGWRGTTLILAGFFFNLAVCGCLMRDLEWTTVRAKAKSEERKRNREKKRTIKIQSSSVDSFSASSSANTANITHHTLHTTTIDGVQRIHIENDASKVFSSLLNLPTFIKNGDQVPVEVLDLLAMRKDVSNVLFHNYPTLLTVSRSFSESTPITDAMIHYPNIVETEQPNKTQTMCQNITDNDAHTTTHTFNNNNHHHDNDIETIGDNNRDDVITANHWWLNKLQMDNSFKRAVTFEVQRRIPPPCLNNMRMQRHSLTYRGAMLNINRYRLRASSCPDIYRNSVSANAKTKLVWYSGLWEFWDLLVDMLDFSHFADSRFLLFSISNFLLHTWYDVPYVYLTDNAIEMGYSETDASILISIIGIANMFGEILLGWAGDIACVNASIVYAICMIICGAITSLIPLAVFNYYTLCSVSGAFGMFIAANYSLTSIILVEVITLERFTNAYGLLLLVQGIANLMGPPLAGWLYDITGTYDLSFYLAGFFIALSGVLLMVVPLISLYKKCTKKNNVNITNVDFVGTDNV
ncbi:hypothetical protein PV326_012800 [Microctonus aethiopoides]|nr:hypothetical protein PV326_012800 [Microctonus aethiopoides]